jgi:hypothetical protein
VLTKNLTIFIKIWRFYSFFDEAFTVTSRLKTIAALRLCVLDGNDNALDIDTKRCFFKFGVEVGVEESIANAPSK